MVDLSNFSKLQNELENLAKSLQGNKKGGMTVTSVQNCTRFPISVLKYCDWVESENLNIYGRSVRFMKLTKHGYDTVKQIKQMKDIRLIDYEKSTFDQKSALIRLGAYQMLGRAKFNLSDVKEKIERDEAVCKDILEGKEILLSPYQTLEYSVVNSALDIRIDTAKKDTSDKHLIHIAKKLARELKEQTISASISTCIDEALITKDVELFVNHVNELKAKKLSDKAIVEQIVDETINDKKTEYYPLIETLFRIMGVDCHKSRDGVNGERWDAMIRDHKRSIPIEIKSPTEEMHISIKAIRQALENKIILLSRKTYITTDDCSTFAVGYYSPNDRAEVSDLISDIKKTYGYSIAVFDLKSLVQVAVNIILNKKGIDKEKLYGLEGIVNVTDIES